MSKVIVNGKVVEPAKKVKLYKKIGSTKVTQMIKAKQEEMKRKKG